MPQVQVIRDMQAPASAAERLWTDVSRWSGFVDGFRSLVSQEGGWPTPGAEVVWESTPAGRGRVVERVLSHRPGEGIETAFEDPDLTGVQHVAFEPVHDGVGINLELEYELKNPGPLSAVTDFFFIRRALRDSLRRTLRDFSYELRSELELR